jgi:type IV pilus assembly protein PilA
MMSNAVWFYADASRQQQGPVDSATLAQLFGDGRIDARTLLWREGLPGWQSVAALGDEVPWVRAALATASTPPPMPVATPSTPRPPAKAGMGRGAGCAIAIGVAAVVGVPLFGILAAITIPAYQDYQHRALLMQHIAAAAPIKLRVAEAFQRDGACPDDIGLKSDEVPDGFSEVWVGRFEDGTCGAQFTFGAIERLPQVEGKKLWFWLDEADGGWRCSSDLEDRFLPASCRG